MKIGISGINGAMGKAIIECLNEMNGIEIAFGISNDNKNSNNEYKIFENPLDINISCDVIIDFSNVSNIDNLLEYCLRSKTSVVVALYELFVWRRRRSVGRSCDCVPCWLKSSDTDGTFLIFALKETNRYPFCSC